MYIIHSAIYIFLFKFIWKFKMSSLLSSIDFRTFSYVIDVFSYVTST